MRVLFLFFMFFLYLIPVYAQDFSAIDSLLMNALDDSKPGPGIAVGVVQNGEVVFERYLGMANLEYEIPVNEKTRFNIASNAKQFTALTILKLEAEGKLSLNDDLRDYFPELYPNIEEPIRILDLIHHSSGIRDYCDLIGLKERPWWSRVGLDNDDVYDLVATQSELNFTPGTDFMYSNSNYILLTAIVEKITGKSFLEYAKEMFVELGMKETSYPGDYSLIIPNRAGPYSNWGSGKWSLYPAVSDLYGDGFLFTTLKDQLIWEQYLHSNSVDKSWVVKSQSKENLAPNGINGYGIEFRDYYEKDMIRHIGETGSYRAIFLRFMDQNFSVVIMSNNGNFNYYRMAYRIARNMLGIPEGTERKDYLPENISSKESPLEQWVGKYRRPEGQLIDISERNDTLYWNMHKQEELQITHIKGDLFEVPDIEGLKFHFTGKGEDRKYTAYYPGSKPRIHAGVEPKNPFDEKTILQQKGTFVNAELDMPIEFKPVSDKEFMVFFDRKDRKGLFLTSDHWVVGGHYLKPVWNEANQIEAILVDYARLKNVRFDRKGKWEGPKRVILKSGAEVSIATTSKQYGEGYGDILITKNAPDGNEIWFKSFGGTSYEIAESLLATKDGGYLIIGSTSSFGAGNYDVWIIKTNDKGEKEWEKTIGTGGNEYGVYAREVGDEFEIQYRNEAGLLQKRISNTGQHR